MIHHHSCARDFVSSGYLTVDTPYQKGDIIETRDHEGRLVARQTVVQIEKRPYLHKQDDGQEIDLTTYRLKLKSQPVSSPACITKPTT